MEHDMTASGVSLDEIIDTIYNHVGYPEQLQQVCARLLMEVIDLKEAISKLEDKVLDLERAES